LVNGGRPPGPPTTRFAIALGKLTVVARLVVGLRGGHPVIGWRREGEVGGRRQGKGREGERWKLTGKGAFLSLFK